MAFLKFEDGRTFTDLKDICRELQPLHIELSHWPIEKTEKVGALLKSDVLNDSQKDELLKALDNRFEEQKGKYGYQTRDLVVLHSQTPNLGDMLKIFDKCHRHSDDEVRYIIDGSGIFGFCMPNGQQAMLTVQAEEYIRVPAETEHWFILDEHRRIKAVRYFTSKEGWVANYSGSPVRLQLDLTLKEAAEQIVTTGRFLAAQGWSPATSSNYSVKLNSQRIAITRSGMDKHTFGSSDVIEVSPTGEMLPTVGASVAASAAAAMSGVKPSAETLIHTTIYKMVPSAKAVLHTHSPRNTRLSLKYAEAGAIEFAGYELQKGLAGIDTHDSKVRVPILPNAQDMLAFSRDVEKLLGSAGQAKAAELNHAAGSSSGHNIHGFLIAGHGLYTWGASMAEAQRHVETFEFLFECKTFELAGV